MLLRRTRGQVQVGLRRPVVMAASPAVARTFDEASGQIIRAADAALADALETRALVVPSGVSAVLRPAVGDAASRAAARDRAASVSRHGHQAEASRYRRLRPVSVLVHGAAGSDIADEVDRLLRSAGGAGLAPAVLGEAAAQGPVLIASDGEPPRAWSDALVRAETPHLYLRAVESAVLLGPWVEPGVTGCLRCDDLGRAAADPAWPLLVQQASARGAHERRDGVPSPIDALSLASAAAMAARDLVRDAEGLLPDLWSTELRWGPPSHLEDPAGADQSEHGARFIDRHAACGCICWGEAWQ